MYSRTPASCGDEPPKPFSADPAGGSRLASEPDGLARLAREVLAAAYGSSGASAGFQRVGAEGWTAGREMHAVGERGWRASLMSPTLSRRPDLGARRDAGPPSRGYPRHHLLELRPLQRGEDVLLHARTNFEALGDDNGLSDEVVGELLVQIGDCVLNLSKDSGINAD
jgi:hypothetical protein